MMAIQKTTARSKIARHSTFSNRAKRRPEIWLIGITILLATMLGGSPTVLDWRLLLISSLSTVTISYLVYSRKIYAFYSISTKIKYLLILAFTTPFLQLLPLPPFVWQSFPERDTIRVAMDLIESKDRWRPLTVDTLNTITACLSLLSTLAVFFGVLSLSRRSIRQLIALNTALCAISITVGIVQVSSGGNIFNFYGGSHQGLMLGFFANRNHMATYITISMLLCFSLFPLEMWSTTLSKGGHSVKSITAENNYKIAIALFCLIATLATASRSGIIFILICIFFGAINSIKIGSRSKNTGAYIILGLSTVVFTLGIFSTEAARSLSRFSDFNDMRPVIWQQSVELLYRYMPVGSGIGTFSETFKVHEELEWVGSLYVNRAHSDILEFCIEAGAVGAASLLLGLYILLGLSKQAISSKGKMTLVTAGTISLWVLFFHSIFDYPLRTIAISTLAGLLLGLVAKSPDNNEIDTGQ